MGTTFRPYQPDQMLLLPQDLREWVGEGHLAHHVSDLVDALDLSPFYAPYEGDVRRNLKDFEAVFAEVVRLARGWVWRGLAGSRWTGRRSGPTRASARR